MNLTKRIPAQVAIINESAPIKNILRESIFKNVVACVEIPTVNPRRIVTISINGPLAVSARRRVTPDSFSRLPKKSIPTKGKPEGTKNVVKSIPIIGNKIFSV